METKELTNSDESGAVFSALKRFARTTQPVERCELCGLALAAEHPHLLEKQSRRISCSCEACAILFCGQQGGRFLRVPRRVRALENFSLTELEWEELMIPIHLAFFFRNEDGRLTAMYPSPGGAIESQLPLESLRARFHQHTHLRELDPLVEALLVNRVGEHHTYLIAPIDECFRLVGLIRMKWRGLSGGTEVWGAIAGFFEELEQRAGRVFQERHA
jgi:hypothetical protein